MSAEARDSAERMAETMTCVAQRIDVAVDRLGALSAEAVTMVSVLDALADVLKRGVAVQERMERRLDAWEERFAPLFDKVQADAGLTAGLTPPPAPPTKPALRVRKGNKNKKGV